MTSRAALAVILSLATVTTAQTKRPMTFADLQAMHRLSDPQISPSGKWVLFSVTDVNLDKNIKINHLWLVPLAGGKELQLTSASGESNGRFSPDGKWIAFSHEDQIWVAPFDDATGTLGDDHVVTALETGADGAIWAPDSKHILFTSAVYPECESHAPLGPQRNDETANCNALKDATAARSPTQARIFTDLLYRHWNQFMGPRHSHIFYADISSGTHLTPTDLTPASVVGDHEAPTFSLGGPLGYAISPDGREVAYVVNLDKIPAESTNNDIFVLDPTADPSTARKVSISPGSDDGPQYSPDSKYLAWRSQARAGFESDRFRLTIYDRNAKSSQNLNLDLKDYSKPGKPTETDLDRWVDEFTWSNNSERIYFVAGDHGEEVVFGTNFTGDDLHRFGKISGEWGGLIEVPGDAKSHAGQWVATYMRVDQPTEIVVIDPYKMDTDGVTFINAGLPRTERGIAMKRDPDISIPTLDVLTHLNDSLLAALDLPKMESFTFPGANGTKVQGFLIRPPNFDPAKKYPVKFLIHGGPQGAWGDAWSYRWNPELFAANGYVVVMVNPRGSTGYGQKFLEQVSGDWGGRPYIDLMKGLDFAEAKYPFIDKTRECALGASYGGFMADYILTHTNRFACIVTHDGMYNPQSAFGTTEELWFNEWEFRPLAGKPHITAKLNLHGADESEATAAGDAVVEQAKPAHPWDFYDLPASEDPFRKFSPMLSIKNAKTPTLVIHGQKDYRLDVSEGLQLFDALQILHVPSKMLYFPDEGHWVLKPQNSKLWYETINDWCDQYTHTNAYAK